MNRTSLPSTALITTPPNSFVGGNSRNSAKLHKQRGFDLIQIAIVIGVIGILMAGAFIGVPAVMASVRATGEAQDIQAYVNNQQALLNNSAEISNKTVFDNKLYNPDLATSASVISNRFGGTQTISGKANETLFTITSTQIPRRACEKLVPVVAPLFEVVTIGKTVVKDAGAATAVSPTRSTITAACLGTGGVVEIIYTGFR